MNDNITGTVAQLHRCIHVGCGRVATVRQVRTSNPYGLRFATRRTFYSCEDHRLPVETCDVTDARHGGFPIVPAVTS